MFPNLTVSCTECTNKKSLPDYFARAFERMENFWQGNEKRPVLNRKIIPAICLAGDQFFDANFKEHDNVYASTKFELDSGYVSVTFYPYPNSINTDGNKFPAFNLPIDVYRGKYVL
jgi:hypothetical protein